MSFITRRQLATELKRSVCWKHFRHYQKAINKVETNSLRVKFLESCKRSDLTPKFLKFRIPTNGCFDTNSVKEFQRKLLYKELLKAKSEGKQAEERLEETRAAVQSAVPDEWLSAVAYHTRMERISLRKNQLKTHNKKAAKSIGRTRTTPLQCEEHSANLRAREQPTIICLRDTFARSKECSSGQVQST